MTQVELRQKREERILSTLAKLTYSTREQLQAIENLGGERNASRILLEMERKKLIRSIRYEKKIYYLTNRGSERIGRGGVNLKRSWIQHTLMRNDLYIRLGQPLDWQREVPIYYDSEIFLVPDALFKKNGIYHFIEIDNTQTMKSNYDKISKYKELFPNLKQRYRHTPILIWYSLSDLRKEKLKAACEKADLKFEIY